ncbi:MAG: histidine--tRNA ligase [Pseudomonadota bacterium]
MRMNITRVRGTQDIYDEQLYRHLKVSNSARSICERFGYREIQTPIFEDSSVFTKSLGQATDVVQKEMYNFVDKGGHSITLRPENTASIMRAFFSNNMAEQVPVRLFYQGAMFRYERPQKGRLRQFHQIGAELIGVSDALADVELIICAQMILEELGVAKHAKLHLNTLGSIESRMRWRDALVEYFTRYKNDLSEISQKRLEINPLRILDSKNKDDRALLADMPAFEHYIDAPSKKFFDEVQSRLQLADIKWHLDPTLVRGLDYYCHTAFEFVTDMLGAQGTLIGGGRYDGLARQLCGLDVPGVGWAGGIERLAMMVELPSKRQLRTALVAIGEQAREPIMKLARELRLAGYIVIVPCQNQLKKAMREAERANADICLILGEDEIKNSTIQWRELKSATQFECPFESVKSKIHEYKNHLFTND